jgi:hypothetical protein
MDQDWGGGGGKKISKHTIFQYRKFRFLKYKL